MQLKCFLIKREPRLIRLFLCMRIKNKALDPAYLVDGMEIHLCSHFLCTSSLPFLLFFLLRAIPQYSQYTLFIVLFLSAIAPDFSQNLLKAQTLTRQGGDVLIECKPRMSPRGIISWRKGKEALREGHRYTFSLSGATSTVYRTRV